MTWGRVHLSDGGCLVDPQCRLENAFGAKIDGNSQGLCSWHSYNCVRRRWLSGRIRCSSSSWRIWSPWVRPCTTRSSTPGSTTRSGLSSRRSCRAVASAATWSPTTAAGGGASTPICRLPGLPQAAGRRPRLITPYRSRLTARAAKCCRRQPPDRQLS